VSVKVGKLQTHLTVPDGRNAMVPGMPSIIDKTTAKGNAYKVTVPNIGGAIKAQDAAYKKGKNLPKPWVPGIHSCSTHAADVLFGGGRVDVAASRKFAALHEWVEKNGQKKHPWPNR